MKRAAWFVVLIVGMAVLVAIPGQWLLARSSQAGVGSLPAALVAAPIAHASTEPPPWVTRPHRTQRRALVSAAPLPTPVQVTIPSIGVAADIVPVGVTAQNLVKIPADGQRLGWYDRGVSPGSRQGSAVLVGHRDTRDLHLGVLYQLDQVNVGDTVTVRLADRSQRSYRVVERRLYEKQNLPWSLFFATSGPPRLTLITCGGDFIADQGGYQDNLIVTALPV